MELNRYDTKTKELIEEIRQMQARLDKEVLSRIKRLEKTAKRLKDDNLLGFVYYNLADVYYYTLPDYEQYKSYLEKAIGCLLHCDDPELLARAYNFMAANAHNSGMYDIAYNYYMMALHLCLPIQGSPMPALMYANIGRLYAELGELKLARKNLRTSIRVMRKHKKELLFYRNAIVIYFMDGMVCCEAGDTDTARKNLETIGRYIEESNGRNIADIGLPCALLRTRIALADGTKKAVLQAFEETMDCLTDDSQIYEYMDDIEKICAQLLRRGFHEEIGRLLSAVEGGVQKSGVLHLVRALTSLKIAYYEKTGEEEKLVACLKEQHEITRGMREEQQQMYRYSIDLIGVMNDLREEAGKVTKENALLQMQVQTDTLTGVPNRFAMNKALEAAFERAYEKRIPLGVEILDVDHFKEYNDTYGHQAGDKCLILIGRALMRLSDHPQISCARYGGDEFVIIYEGMSDRDILEKAALLEKELARHKIAHKKNSVSQYVTVSQGICNDVPAQKNKLWDYLSEADNALYTIKKSRNARGKRETISLRKIPDTYKPKKHK